MMRIIDILYELNETAQGFFVIEVRELKVFLNELPCCVVMKCLIAKTILLIN